MLVKTHSQTITIPRDFPAGQVVAVDVSEEEYMEHYADAFHEWVEGVVIKMSPVTYQHDEITGFCRELLRAYFAFKPIGIVKGEPFVLRLHLADRVARREPDLQIILNENLPRVQDTYTDGPADICIEVVSPGSVAVDYGEKFEEYEAGGMGEYWIIDPIRQQPHFYRLTDEGRYKLIMPDENGIYTTPKLPGLKLEVALLWQEPLPDIVAVVQRVQALLAE